MFPEATKHIISLLSYLLGYENDQAIDESILVLFSIFIREYQPALMYNYNHFLANNTHEQFMNLTTRGVFRYSSVIIHLVLFQQGDLFPIQLNKQDGSESISDSLDKFSKSRII